MKLKNVYSSIALIFLVVAIALWKLNDDYRADKVSIKQNQLQSQSTALRSALVSQISQLRNTLSAYTGQVDESKINWIQLKPFYALALVQEDAANRIAINKLYQQSGSPAERWSSQGLQQSLSTKVLGNQLLRAQIFKDEMGAPHLALAVFDREKRSGQSRTGVMVIGDVSYFQRFFDLQRTSSITQALLTQDKLVTAHSEFEYIGNASNENQISEDGFFIDKQEIRGTNLNLLSYSSKVAQSALAIPYSILGLIVGLGFLMSGILLLMVRSQDESKTESPISAFELSGPPTKERKPIVAKATEPVALNVSAKLPPKVAPNAPLVFDQEPQIVPVQIQACVQQALFNVDKHMKSQGISVSKEFVSPESILLDYPKFIRIFENVLLDVARELKSQSRKKIYLRSYDDGQYTILDIQAPIAELNLNSAIEPELTAVQCEFSQSTSSAGDLVLRFTFTRPEEKVSAEPLRAQDKLSMIEAAIQDQLANKPQRPQSQMPRFDNRLPDLPAAPAEQKTVAPVKDGDLDIDAILSLDDETPLAAPSVVEKEMQPSKFKLDEKMSIVEDPDIAIDQKDDDKDVTAKVKIRRPEKG